MPQNKFFVDMTAKVAADDMTIDKALDLPSNQGNSCVLTLMGDDPSFVLCIWKCPNLDKVAFQSFIDTYIPSCKNTCYEIEGGFGYKHLNARQYQRENINIARGNPSPGFLDAPTLWYVHHHVTDAEGWKEKVTGKMIEGGKACTTPSDFGGLFEQGYNGCLTLFLDNGDAICGWSAPKDNKVKDYQAMVDRFTEGTSKNVPHLINAAGSINAMALSCDQWGQDALAWAKSPEHAKAQGQVAMEGTTQPVLSQ